MKDEDFNWWDSLGSSLRRSRAPRLRHQVGPHALRREDLGRQRAVHARQVEQLHAPAPGEAVQPDVHQVRAVGAAHPHHAVQADAEDEDGHGHEVRRQARGQLHEHERGEVHGDHVSAGLNMTAEPR